MKFNERTSYLYIEDDICFIFPFKLKMSIDHPQPDEKL